MATLLALVLISLGVLEFVNNKRIALIFDSEGRDLRSTARQNILVISLVFMIAGLMLLLMP
jgi:hypothetical protein